MSQNAPGKAFCRGISLIEPMDIFPTCGLKTHPAPASPEMPQEGRGKTSPLGSIIANLLLRFG